MQSIYDITVENIKSEPVSLAIYKGKYLLIVNVASQCGFTPQYKGLEELYQQFKEHLVVLGFPCNQFGSQEPGTHQEIQQFCELNFKTTFPLFAKVKVNGPEAHPLFTFLKGEKPGLLGTEAIKWNFTKFLVDPSGRVIKRFAPQDGPDKIISELKTLIS
jgi:glutathione peroxidase